MNSDIVLSLIIVNYNTASHIEKCLKSIEENISDLNYEIIIVDNNSPNREIETLSQLYPNVKFYFNEVNNGFGAGCNFGAAMAKGKYLAFINPDIVFTDNALKDLTDYLENHHETGFCSGAFTDTKGNTTYTYNKFPSYYWEFIEALGFGSNWVIGKLIHELEKLSKIKKYIEVDWVYGACMVVTAKVFRLVNGFDETFFLFYEDIDLQLRIHKMGYKIICIPGIKIQHETNVSTKDTEQRDIYFIHMNRSKILYMYKHFGFLKRNLIRFIHIVGILLRRSALPFRNKFKNIRNVKSAQYYKILRLYLMNHESLINLKY